MNTPLFLVVVKRVGNNRMAEQCEVSPQYISKLAREFETGARTELPPAIVLPVCRADEWRTSPHQWRPDLYPHPDDGLPPELRGKLQIETTDAAGDLRVEAIPQPAQVAA